jgi:hemerythrin-like metal-binding protein
VVAAIDRISSLLSITKVINGLWSYYIESIARVWLDNAPIPRQRKCEVTLALLEWNQKFSVGVEYFDEQHKRLFILLNQLHDGMRAGHNKTILHAVLRELAAYTEEHFAAEEAAMALHNYAGLAAHRAEHDELRAKVQSYLKKCEAGELALNVEIVNFVLKWLVEHIMKTDREYSWIFGGLPLLRIFGRPGASPRL